MFSRLSSYCVDNEIILDATLAETISSHLLALKSEFVKYFPDIGKPEFDLIRNPFLLENNIDPNS